MTDHLHGTLVRFKAVEQDGRIVGMSDVEPSVAEGYVISDDGRTYTFSGARIVSPLTGSDLPGGVPRAMLNSRSC